MVRMLVIAMALLAAEDFDALRREYEAAKTEVNRQRDRGEQIEKKVAPVLDKIGGLKSAEAVRFLADIVMQEMPELAAAACRPLAATAAPEAVEVLLKASETRPPQVKAAALAALRDKKAKLSETQAARVKLQLLGKGALDLRQAAARLLGAQDDVASARALVQALGAPKIEDELAVAIEQALSGCANKDVLEYLFGTALGGEAKAPRQSIALMRIAVAKKAARAAAAIEKLVDHPSDEVASQAIASLSALGVESGGERVFALLKKWRGNTSQAVRLLVGLAETPSAGTAAILVRVSREFPGPIGIAALSLLGKAKSGAGLGRLLEALGDKDPAVKAAALKGVQLYRETRMIGPLIDFMAAEEGRLKGDAYRLLVGLTGQNFGLQVDDWKKWWEIEKERFKFAQADQGGKTQVRVRDADYYGIEIFSDRVCFIIDCSSSMTAKARDPETKQESTRIALAKKELLKAIEKLKSGVQINIMHFHTSVASMAKQLTPLTPAGRAQAVRFVRNLATGTGTNIYDSLSEAIKDERVDTIFLLSDGAPTRGRFTDAGTILGEIRIQNAVRNVTINTIAVGSDLGEGMISFMKRLAAENSGSFVHVKD